MTTPPDDMGRILAAIGGDRLALERLLLDHYGPLAERIAPRVPAMLRSILSVDDVVQQTYAQVFRDIARYEPRAEATFLDWLGAIAENRLRDELRAAHRRKRGGEARRLVSSEDDDAAAALIDSLLGDSQTPSRALARQEAVMALTVALAQLPQSQQQAVRVHFLEGQTLEQTATIMGCTTGAVRGLIDRGKDNLREALGRASRYFTRK